jgi:hypothetical protein
MAAPATIATNYVSVATTGATSLDTTNSASRQLVTVTNPATNLFPVTIVESSSGSPTITAGQGVVLMPGATEWFWNGQGARLYGQVGPVPAGETAAAQSVWVVEKV